MTTHDITVDELDATLKGQGTATLSGDIMIIKVAI